MFDEIRNFFLYHTESTCPWGIAQGLTRNGTFGSANDSGKGLATPEPEGRPLNNNGVPDPASGHYTPQGTP